MFSKFSTDKKRHFNTMAKIVSSKLPYPKVENENLSQLILSGLKKHSSNVLLIDSNSDRRWTGSQIESTVANIAKFLIYECDLKKGDVCSIYGDDSDSIAIITLAIVASGGVASQLGSNRAGRDVHDTAKAIKSRFLFSSSDLLFEIQKDLQDIADQLLIISFKNSAKGCLESWKDISAFFAIGNPLPSFDANDICKNVVVDPETDFAVFQFSSGTTGKPKPIPRTHKNLSYLVATPNDKELINLKPGDIVMGTLSLCYRPGLWILLSSIICGSTMVIWTDTTNIESALKMIAKYKVTLASFSLPVLSTLGSTCKDFIRKYDTSSLKECMTTGAKLLNEELPRKIISTFNLEILRQSFGMTESGMVFLNERSSSADNFLSVGHVTPGTEAKVINRETGEILGPNQRGEICIRGPQIFPGYLTEEPGRLNKSDIDDEGFFHIGDRGYYDENELFFIEGRFKEWLVFQNNQRFFPSEIETLILELPAIEDVCVIKVGQVNKDFPYDIAKAFVTLRSGLKLTSEEILSFLKKRAPVDLSGGVQIVKSFPRFPNGKINKKALSESRCF